MRNKNSLCSVCLAALFLDPIVEWVNHVFGTSEEIAGDAWELCIELVVRLARCQGSGCDSSSMELIGGTPDPELLLESEACSRTGCSRDPLAIALVCSC